MRSFDGATIRYTVRGSGPVIALCAGFLCPDTYWKYIVPAIEDEYAFIIWNYRGIGVSELPRPPGFHAHAIDPDELSIEVNAKDLHAILEAEKIDHAVLVGHSMGVQVILEAYEHDAERVAGLVCIAGPYETPLRTFYGTDASARLAPVVLPLLHLLPRTSLVAWRGLVHNPLAYRAGRVLRAIGPRARREDIEGYFDHVSRIDPLIISKMIRGMHSHSAEALLPKIDVPVLIAHGTSDPFTPLAVAREMADRIPDAKLVVFEGGSHTLPIEYPEEIVEAIRPFLKRVSDLMPFPDELRAPVGFSSPQDRLRELPERGVVVRLVPEPLSGTDRLARCLALFTELTTFGVAAPPISAVVGHAVDATRSGYIVTRRVSGRSLADAFDATPERAARAAGSLTSALSRYYSHKFERGGDYLVDMRPEQFVLGTLPGGVATEAPYWVDHDPVYVTFDPTNAGPVAIAQAHWAVANIVNILVRGELAVGRKLTDARAALEPLLAWMLTSDGGRARRQLIDQALRDGEIVQGRWWVSQERAKLDEPNA